MMNAKELEKVIFEFLDNGGSQDKTKEFVDHYIKTKEVNNRTPNKGGSNCGDCGGCIGCGHGDGAVIICAIAMIFIHVALLGGVFYEFQTAKLKNNKYIVPASFVMSTLCIGAGVSLVLLTAGVIAPTLQNSIGDPETFRSLQLFLGVNSVILLVGGIAFLGLACHKIYQRYDNQKFAEGFAIQDNASVNSSAPQDSANENELDPNDSGKGLPPPYSEKPRKGETTSSTSQTVTVGAALTNLSTASLASMPVSKEVYLPK